MIYRGMRKHWDGRPLVVGTKNGLGVRSDDDIFPDEDGRVEPDSGGMSVCFVPEAVPPYRRPPSFGGDSEQNSMWELDESELPDGLVCRATSQTHAMLEPAWEMDLREYEELLAETRDLWRELP